MLQLHELHGIEKQMKCKTGSYKLNRISLPKVLYRQSSSRRLVVG